MRQRKNLGHVQIGMSCKICNGHLDGVAGTNASRTYGNTKTVGSDSRQTHNELACARSRP